jgi:hypothetical protein
MSIVPLLSAQRGSDPVNAWELGVLSDGGSFVAPSNTDALYDRLVSLGLVASASLVNSCNGGKADALYNFVPTPVQSLDRFVVTRASTKLRIGSNGLYGSVANNVPAFEFNTDGSYRGLLVEPGATNLALRSQAFDEAIWTKVNATVTQNATTAPDGSLTAEKLIADTASGVHGLSQPFTGLSGAYTYSIFAKSAGYDFISFGQGNPGARTYFNLALGTVLGNAIGTPTNATITSLPNGWKRCTVTIASAPATPEFIVRPHPTGTGSEDYVGNGTDGVFIWQAQLETGSVATSPIVTTAGTASRVADVVSLTGASSLIGATEGTFYAEVIARNYTAPANRRILNIRVDGNNVISLDAKQTIRRYGFDVTNGGALQAEFTSGDIMTDNVKLAGAYKVNDFAFYINGNQIGTDTSGTVPNVTTGVIGLGIRGDGGAGTEFNGWIRSVALFPTRLANATLASLTA